jgi:hypothetical protein
LEFSAVAHTSKSGSCPKKSQPSLNNSGGVSQSFFLFRLKTGLFKYHTDSKPEFHGYYLKIKNWCVGAEFLACRLYSVHKLSYSFYRLKKTVRMKNPFKPAFIFNSDFFIMNNYFLAIMTDQSMIPF